MGFNYQLIGLVRTSDCSRILDCQVSTFKRESDSWWHFGTALRLVLKVEGFSLGIFACVGDKIAVFEEDNFSWVGLWPVRRATQEEAWRRLHCSCTTGSCPWKSRFKFHGSHQSLSSVVEPMIEWFSCSTGPAHVIACAANKLRMEIIDCLSEITIDIVLLIADSRNLSKATQFLNGIQSQPNLKRFFVEAYIWLFYHLSNCNSWMSSKRILLDNNAIDWFWSYCAWRSINVELPCDLMKIGYTGLHVTRNATDNFYLFALALCSCSSQLTNTRKIVGGQRLIWTDSPR